MLSTGPTPSSFIFVKIVEKDGTLILCDGRISHLKVLMVCSQILKTIEMQDIIDGHYFELNIFSLMASEGTLPIF